MVDLLAEHHDITFIYCGSSPSDEKYLSWLRRRGVTALPSSTSLSALVRSNPFQAAVIEFYFTAEYYLPRLKLLAPDCPVLVDSVDVHFVREALRADLTGAGADREQARRTKRREIAQYRRADLVIAVTEDDAAAIRQACPRVPVGIVPNIHSLALAAALPDNDELIFVGNFAHTPNVDAVLHFVREVLPHIASRVPDARLTVVGANPPPEVLSLQGPSVRVTGHVPSTTPYLHASRVSVAPLRYGAGMKGKIGEAMAHGIPVVTTSVGAQGMGVRHREHLLIADRPDDFAAAVLELLTDRSLCVHLRSAAARHIAEHYSPETVASSLEDLLLRAGERPARRPGLWDMASFAVQYVAGRFRAGSVPPR